MSEVILRDGRRKILRKGMRLCPSCHGTGEVHSGRLNGRTVDGKPRIEWNNPWLVDVVVRSFVCLTCDGVYFTNAYPEDDLQANPPCGHIIGQRNIEEIGPFDPKKLEELKGKGKIPKTKWTRGKPS